MIIKSSPAKAIYLNCYNDSETIRDLSFIFRVNLKNTTVSMCLDGCANLGYRYAGLQNG